MAKIIKLDKHLANQIAAGEVVERPVSIVKECVENSIDAGATNIIVEIENGGCERISIKDNGEGIEKDDLPLVFEKYSTSKIKNIEDLYNIMTFGFRGEAMASISSVSNIQLTSKHIDTQNGFTIFVEDGETSEITPGAIDTGTHLHIKKLFYNTPARLNYLKTPKTEYAHIAGFLEQIALSYPHIGFEFLSDNKQIFKYPKNETLQERIYHIYGEEFANNLIPLNVSLHGIQIEGYISSPSVSFPNKNRQSLFVNKRSIKSYLINKAIQDAYNRFIPHHSYPAYILNLQIDPTQIDVNVHPRKMEIRFASEQNIFRSTYYAIEESLNQVSLIKTPNSTQSPLNYHIPQEEQQGNQLKEKQEKYYISSGTKFKSYSPYSYKTNNPSQSHIGEALQFSHTLLKENNFGDKQNKDIPQALSNDFQHYDENNLHNTPLGTIIGQAHNSYILVETQHGIQILDQHALAERVIYEKLKNKESKITSQGLLIGENLTLTPQEHNILEHNLEAFQNMGFDFEMISGNSIIINGIPDFIKKENLKEIFLGVLDDIGEEKFHSSKTLEEVKNKIFAYTSCRSAIKFGHKLSLFEINKLLKDAVLDYSLTCPHGRPVVYEIDLNELKTKYER